MGIEQKAGNMGVVTVGLEQAVNWARVQCHVAHAFRSGMLCH